jgi:hypothetical protein
VVFFQGKPLLAIFITPQQLRNCLNPFTGWRSDGGGDDDDGDGAIAQMLTLKTAGPWQKAELSSCPNHNHKRGDAHAASGYLCVTQSHNDVTHAVRRNL